MSIRAYPVEKEYTEDYIMRKTILSNSFNLWGLTDDEEKLLWTTNFYDQLNEDCAGFTDINADEIEIMKERAKELKYQGDLIDIIEQDMKDYGDGDFIEYQCF